MLVDKRVQYSDKRAQYSTPTTSITSTRLGIAKLTRCQFQRSKRRTFLRLHWRRCQKAPSRPRLPKHRQLLDIEHKLP